MDAVELFVPHTPTVRITETDLLREQLYESEGNFELLTERLAELEMELDDGWIRLAGDAEHEFSRGGLKQIISLARIMWLKNPLIQRAVNVQAFYTWAQGVQVGAADTKGAVNEVVQRFWDDPGNRRAVTGEQALLANDQTCANDGNLFFVLFPNVITGHVRIRTILVDEITDIITNPQDRSEPWFYRREWQERNLAADGSTPLERKKALYPAMRYQPGVRIGQFAGMPIMWESPVYHVKTGGLGSMRFGVPETYAALSWARAYKNFLEDWASLVRSLSRFAWRLTTKNSKVQSAKTRLGSTISTDQRETNPPAATGAAFIGDPAANLEAIPKTGAHTSAEDGKQLRLMVASAMNLPDTMLSGDVDQGNLATSKTLDRPTELAFLARQGMWREVFEDILRFVVQASVRATRGKLTGAVVVDADGLEEIVLADQADPNVNVTFPPILEHDVDARVKAIISAKTLDGKAPAQLIPDETASRMLLDALGADDIDELIEQVDQNRETAAAAGITEPMVEALREAKRALEAAA